MKKTFNPFKWYLYTKEIKAPAQLIGIKINRLKYEIFILPECYAQAGNVHLRRTPQKKWFGV